MTTSSLVAELEKLANRTGAEDSGAQPSLAEVGAKIAKNLGVNVDEVAILGVSNRWRHLHFLVPEALKNVGFIPLTSKSALAARTVRERRPEINNKFTEVRHASVFEGVKAATTTGESIQKIISAPIFCDGQVIGVLQVSRKGSSADTAGADFMVDELERVVALCGPLGKLVKNLSGD